jgi:hypothetical protein
MNRFHLVDVRTDRLLGRVTARQLWVAAGYPEDAVDIVLAKVPEGWAASLSAVKLSAEQIDALQLTDGDARELTF